MSLVSKLSVPPAKEVKCLTCNWLSTLPDEELHAIRKAIVNPDWTITGLWRVLKDEGMPVAESTFRTHVVQNH